MTVTFSRRVVLMELVCSIWPDFMSQVQSMVKMSVLLASFIALLNCLKPKFTSENIYPTNPFPTAKRKKN
jgi:hypothetical protein